MSPINLRKTVFIIFEYYFILEYDSINSSRTYLQLWDSR